MDSLVLAMFMALCNERFIEATFAKLFDLITKPWGKTALMVFTWITGGVGAWLAKVDLFSVIAPKMDPIASLVLSALVVGGGSNLIHMVFGDKKSEMGK